MELLSGFRDNFCQKLDNSVVGIRSTITRLSELLKKNDEELWRHLEITTKVRVIIISQSVIYVQLCYKSYVGNCINSISLILLL